MQIKKIIDGMLASKLVSHPMDPRHKTSSFDGDLLSNPSQYTRLIGRLLCITITRPYNFYVVRRLNQFIYAK